MQQWANQFRLSLVSNWPLTLLILHSGRQSNWWSSGPISPTTIATLEEYWVSVSAHWTLTVLPDQGAIADYSYQTLIDVGVDVKPSQAGFYLFPNFELCREKLAAKGVKTGQDMCDLLFEEKRIAVSWLTRGCRWNGRLVPRFRVLSCALW